MNQRLYLCGPMSGLPDHNRPAFDAMAAQLRGMGYDVFNPAENGLPADAPWADHMRADITALMQCTALACLPGHLESRGATLERYLARELGMRIFDADLTQPPFSEPLEA